MWVIEEIYYRKIYMGNKEYQKNKICLEYSKNQVSKAGICIRKGQGDISKAIDVIQNFRAAHLYPLMIVKNLIWKHAQKIKPDPIIARRLKRLPTIINKLQRETLDGVNPNSLDLRRLQDIGGCRIILNDRRSLLQIDQLLEKSKTVHKTIKKRDYIKDPKSTGYRGIHRIYKTFQKSDDSHNWKGFLIEVQMRTRLQHVWATTIEVVDIFENKDLKTNPFNADPKWIEFFKIMSDLFAHEEQFIILSTAQLMAYKNRLLHLNTILRATDKLLSFNKASSSKNISNQANKFEAIILAINCEIRKFSIEYFEKKGDAVEKYNNLEVKLKDDDNYNFVLVEIDELKNLKKAYPNYWIDTSEFVAKYEYYTTAYYWTPK